MCDVCTHTHTMSRTYLHKLDISELKRFKNLTLLSTQLWMAPPRNTWLSYDVEHLAIFSTYKNSYKNVVISWLLILLWYTSLQNLVLIIFLYTIMKNCLAPNRHKGLMKELHVPVYFFKITDNKYQRKTEVTMFST